MHVQVDDGHAQRATGAVMARVFGLHQPGRHGSVVEDAEAAALVGIGVVRAAGQVGRQPLARHRIATGLDGRAHRAPCPFAHGRAPGETDFSLRAGVQRALADRTDVARRMRQRQLTVAGGQRLPQTHLRPFGGQALAQAPVLRHREAVPAGQGQDEVVGVVSVHGGRDLGRVSEPIVSAAGNRGGSPVF